MIGIASSRQVVEAGRVARVDDDQGDLSTDIDKDEPQLLGAADPDAVLDLRSSRRIRARLQRASRSARPDTSVVHEGATVTSIHFAGWPSMVIAAGAVATTLFRPRM